MEILNRNDDIESWDLVVMYDPEDGSVLHTHHTVTWRGGERPSREQQERSATEQAQGAADRPFERFEFLHTDPTTVESDALLRVDTERKVLVTERQV